MKRLLCLLGLHRWQYINGRPLGNGRTWAIEECERCGKRRERMM